VLAREASRQATTTASLPTSWLLRERTARAGKGSSCGTSDAHGGGPVGTQQTASSLTERAHHGVVRQGAEGHGRRDGAVGNGSSSGGAALLMVRGVLVVMEVVVMLMVLRYGVAGERQGTVRVAVLARRGLMMLAMKVLLLATDLSRRGDAPPHAAT
jgi:hypothetical protein